MNIGINPCQLSEYIIKPVLDYLNMYSQSAIRLLLGTAAQESKLGYYLKQINGRASGIWQIEPGTHDDIYTSYLDSRPKLHELVINLLSHDSGFDDHLIFNLKYACAIARLIYYRVKSPLPHEDDLDGLAQYWKEHYNTEYGKGTPEEFVENYKNLIIPV